MSIIDTTRTFAHFPSCNVCPICRSGKDGVCVLVRIPGTEDGSICKAQPVHLKCAELFNEMNSGDQS